MSVVVGRSVTRELGGDLFQWPMAGISTWRVAHSSTVAQTVLSVYTLEALGIRSWKGICAVCIITLYAIPV